MFLHKCSLWTRNQVLTFKKYIKLQSLIRLKVYSLRLQTVRNSKATEENIVQKQLYLEVSCVCLTFYWHCFWLGLKVEIQFIVFYMYLSILNLKNISEYKMLHNFVWASYK